MDKDLMEELGLMATDSQLDYIRSICDKGVQLPKKADYADFVL